MRLDLSPRLLPHLFQRCRCHQAEGQQPSLQQELQQQDQCPLHQVPLQLQQNSCLRKFHRLLKG